MAANKVVKDLNRLLADATVFYQKLRHYHWNVDGRHFFELHTKFETMYDAWALTIDGIAERILMLDAVPLHTLESLLKAASLKEDEEIPAAEEMVRRIEADLHAIHTFSGKIVDASDKAGDRGTTNLLDAMRDSIEKDLWMLRSWRAQQSA